MAERRVVVIGAEAVRLAVAAQPRRQGATDVTVVDRRHSSGMGSSSRYTSESVAALTAV